MVLRIGVVGYGTGGRHFHTPFIAAAQSCALAGIVARAPKTIAAVREDWPATPIFTSLTEMIEADVCEAVTITTPPQTRRELVLEAITAGLHVIADKPFAPNAAGARELGEAAKAKGITLGVFQNRRFDADLQTLASLSTMPGLAESGAYTTGWTSMIRPRWKPGQPVGCCAISEVIWSIRCSGSWPGPRSRCSARLRQSAGRADGRQLHHYAAPRKRLPQPHLGQQAEPLQSAGTARLW